MPLLDILLSILIVAAIILIGFVVSWMKRIENYWFHIQNDIAEMKDKAIPVLNNLEELTSNAVKISSDASSKVKEVSNIIDNVKDKFSFLLHPGKIKSKSEPIVGLITELKALSRGIAAFVSKIK